MGSWRVSIDSTGALRPHIYRQLKSTSIEMSYLEETNTESIGGSGWIRTTDLTLIRGAL